MVSGQLTVMRIWDLIDLLSVAHENKQPARGTWC